MNSPARRIPNNPRQKAAQSIYLSRDSGLLDHAARILRRRVGVIGSRGPTTPMHRRPLSAHSRWGKAVIEGSG